MINFSRHAKRRMMLYDITEEDVKFVVESGKREISSDGKLNIIQEIEGRYKYPIKIIGIEKKESLLILTAYPLKKRRG